MRASANETNKKTVTDTEPNWVNPFAAAAVQSGAADGGDLADDEAEVWASRKPQVELQATSQQTARASS